MKLKVARIEDTPANCMRRVVLSLDADYDGWIREVTETSFLLWCNVSMRHSDEVYDHSQRKYVHAEFPYAPMLDECGRETGVWHLKDGYIAFPGVVATHGCTLEWSLSKEVDFCQISGPLDVPQETFVLYINKERWDRSHSNANSVKWKFVAGNPTPELYSKALEIAQEEIRALNTFERRSIYRYRVETRIAGKPLTGDSEHIVYLKDSDSENEEWKTVDSFGGFITENPVKDIDYPVGCPVVSDTPSLVGNAFEQKCWAFQDVETEMFVRTKRGGFNFVTSPHDASLCKCGSYANSKAEVYSSEVGRPLACVDVTNAIWGEYPECVMIEGR